MDDANFATAILIKAFKYFQYVNRKSKIVSHNFTFFKYWITHSGLIIVILYTTLVFELYPTAAGIWRTAAVVVAYAGILYGVDLTLNANYMYLRYKPPRQTLLDWLGPWPWYILTATGVMFLLYGLLYLPFFILAR